MHVPALVKLHLSSCCCGGWVGMAWHSRAAVSQGDIFLSAVLSLQVVSHPPQWPLPDGRPAAAGPAPGFQMAPGLGGSRHLPQRLQGGVQAHDAIS